MASHYPPPGYPYAAPGYPAPGYPAPGPTSTIALVEGHPPAAYPPAGYPPVGYPPTSAPAPVEGHPPAGYPPVGYPPVGYPPAGYPPPGYPAPVGYPPQGYAPPAGYPPPGAYPPYGHPPPGYALPPHPGYGPPPHPGYGPPPGYAPPPHGYPPHPGYPGYPPVHPGWHAYGDHHNRGRSRSRSRSPARGGGAKFTCRYFIGIENEGEFQVVKRIIGAGGKQMKDIVARSGGDAKLRLRGKGSGFVERDTNVESPEPLQLCISCPDQDGYNIAKTEAKELLLDTFESYSKWCAEKGLPNQTPELKMSEKHFKGDGGYARGGDRDRGSDRGRGRTPRRQKEGRGQRQQSAPAVDGPSDGGSAPDGAPSVEEINKCISDRNEARKQGNYEEADRIRNYLKDKRVVLCDEKGGYGNPNNVTSFRYWNP